MKNNFPFPIGDLLGSRNKMSCIAAPSLFFQFTQSLQIWSFLVAMVLAVGFLGLLVVRFWRKKVWGPNTWRLFFLSISLFVFWSGVVWLNWVTYVFSYSLFVLSLFFAVFVAERFGLFFTAKWVKIFFGIVFVILLGMAVIMNRYIERHVTNESFPLNFRGTDAIPLSLPKNAGSYGCGSQRFW